jgi:hippurate hydrolase
VRTFTVPVLDLMEQRMRDVASHAARCLRRRVEFNFKRNYHLINAPETAFAVGVMQNRQVDHVDAAVRPTMGSEDFAFMLQLRTRLLCLS